MNILPTESKSTIYLAVMWFTTFECYILTLLQIKCFGYCLEIKSFLIVYSFNHEARFENSHLARLMTFNTFMSDEYSSHWSKKDNSGMRYDQFSLTLNIVVNCVLFYLATSFIEDSLSHISTISSLAMSRQTQLKPKENKMVSWAVRCN